MGLVQSRGALRSLEGPIPPLGLAHFCPGDGLLVAGTGFQGTRRIRLTLLSGLRGGYLTTGHLHYTQ